MDELIFRTWLFAFLFLTVLGPLVMWRNRILTEKISARNPGWIAAGTAAFPGRQMKSWLRIMTGKYVGLDQDLQGACSAFRTWCSVYLVCLLAALAGAVYFVFFEG